MKPNEIRAQYKLMGKIISSTARRLNVKQPAVHQVLVGARTTKYIQAAIAEDIGKPVEEVFPTKEAV